MKFINLSSFILITAMIWSCKNSKLASIEKEYLSKGYVKATVVDNTEIAGCGFSLQLNDSTEITPSKLGDEFKKNKLKVYVKYEVLKKQPNTICMRGKVANITDIIISKKQ